MRFDDFFRCWSFWLGNFFYSYWWLPYQNYYHSVKFANNDFELELGLEHRRSVTCRFPPPQKWDGNQNGSWAAAQSDDSIWRNFPRLRIVHTVRQTQIYAHASFLRRKKGVTDSQFHAVSNHLLSSKPLVLSWENSGFWGFFDLYEKRRDWNFFHVLEWNWWSLTVECI